MTSHAQTLVSCLATNLAGVRVLARSRPDEARAIAQRIHDWCERALCAFASERENARENNGPREAAEEHW